MPLEYRYTAKEKTTMARKNGNIRKKYSIPSTQALK